MGLLVPVVQTVAVSVGVLRIGTVLGLILVRDTVVVVVGVRHVRLAVAVGVELDHGVDGVVGGVGPVGVGDDDRDSDGLGVRAVLAGRGDGHREGASSRVDRNGVAPRSLEARVDREDRAAWVGVALVGRRDRGGFPCGDNGVGVNRLRVDRRLGRSVLDGNRHRGRVRGLVRVSHRHRDLDLT
ncbi:MAG: hypothetical protein Q605_AUC00890G0001, partial [Actinomyces urogenitalis DORA_12]